MSATLPSAANESAAGREARVDAAIAEFLQAMDSGNTPALPEFLAKHADIADELREFLSNHSAFRQLAASMWGAAVIAPKPPEPAAALPRRCGDFELLTELGRGGMGTVYAARRVTDEASVAIKVMHPWLALDVTSLQRFEREVSAMTSLRHPHVIQMISASTLDGVPFLVMQLIDGESLDQVLTRAEGGRFADPRELARRLADVADGLQHAHEQGVIHRDVKPSNLLLARDGRLLIGDFGLARLAQQPYLTRTGETVGSPAYMSPEQIASRAGGTPVDHRTDVYSLGATLYELLTGQPPFVSDSREQLLSSIQHDEPVPPRRLRPDLPQDLETICLKSLEKRPCNRYATAAELAADLRHCAHGESIAARGPAMASRFARWAKRRAVARPRTATALIAATMLLCLFGSTWWIQHAAHATQRQQAIDSALVVALTGDLKATEEAIARAEQAGVSADWLELLRGRVSFHRGEYSAAIQHLEAAAQSNRPTVAAVALQATAQLAAGSWESYETLLDRAESMTASTAEDFLFRGEAEVYFDPRLAVRSLNEAVKRRDTPLARLVRAEARANLAFDTNDLPTAEAALQDAFIARDLLPDHPPALLESLNAHMVAAELWSDAGRIDQRDNEWRAAERDFQALEPFRNLPTVIHNRALFLLLTDRESASFELLRDAESQHRDGLVAYDFALALFRSGESAMALRLLKARVAGEETIGSLTADEAFLRVLLLQDTNERQAARAAYNELALRYQTGLTAYFRPCLLLLLGDAEAATSECRLLQTAGTPPRLRGAFYSNLLAFNSGDLSESELLNATRSSRWDRCEALFFMALKQLARGDRLNARRLFEQCVATRCAGFLSWDWSHAVLRRWKSDPNWPAWIR